MLYFWDTREYNLRFNYRRETYAIYFTSLYNCEWEDIVTIYKNGMRVNQIFNYYIQ
jgi:hypothetical protein